MVVKGKGRRFEKKTVGKIKDGPLAGTPSTTVIVISVASGYIVSAPRVS